jgi:hypothetical protein
MGTSREGEQMKILAIDPGCDESAYILMDENYKPIEFGKVPNHDILQLIDEMSLDVKQVVIEMIASYGMAVGKEVFDTCVWIGRFRQACDHIFRTKVDYIYRKDVKLNLCGQAKAKDSNIIQALKDRFGDKGTQKAKGWFYGFKKDIWQAYAVGVTYLDKQEEKK